MHFIINRDLGNTDQGGDMAGVNVLTKTLHGKSVNIPVSKFAAGSYYVMFTIDGVAFSKKIVVVK